MASTPPQPPSGNPPGRPPGQPPGQPSYGPPYGVPYGANPRDYWRYQKEQNKAAWRANAICGGRNEMQCARKAAPCGYLR